MAAFYELATGRAPITPQPGIFLRHRSNAVSVRARRRRVNNTTDQNDNLVEAAETATSNTAASVTSSSANRGRKTRLYTSEYDESTKFASKSEERLSSSSSKWRSRAYSNEWDAAAPVNRRNSYEDDYDNNTDDEEPFARPVSRRGAPERKSVHSGDPFQRSRSRISQYNR